ncbi:MAG: UDP-N-acetylmuramoyl-L-alanyl-D-glutamate--2,6-diaminopimelate ligase [Actinobacteria bacterium 13_1_20CM_3_71_11]|nr:MAG: UDP-N-acetylmuramoyl-L-alanyl-D-glutamate--2,6-diaminopimelate ligase [Actinobacteria bacterium 13_1_20CM_3_71_11]
MPGYPRPRTVPARPLAELAALLRVPVPAATHPVTGVTVASDTVRPGDLFAALPGARAHGARFIGTAAAAGAVAVLTDPAGAPLAAGAGLPALVVDDPRAAVGDVSALVYGDPTATLSVLGITGTAGKTSTAYLIESGLRAAGQRTGLIGTVETRIDDEVLDSARTTPEASDLQALFAVALERGVTAVAMEVSSHALTLGRVGGTRFAVGGYTNFGTDHLDFHASVEEYFAAKALLFDGRCRYEVLNLDDPALKPLLRPTTITYSAAGDPTATWRAESIQPDGYGQRFRAIGPPGAVEASVALPGRHNVANALLALASLVAVGVEAGVAAAGIAACPGVPGRLERVPAPGPVCVIGAGGDRDRAKRPTMGAAAAEGADLVIVTDDNPRTEDPAAVRAEVLAGAPGAIEVPGRRAAITAAVDAARPGDVIALLGKGHERGQEIGGEVYPFDDRVELAAALSTRFGESS